MRCRTILLLVFALAGSVRLAMAINDLPHYLFPYEPDATDKTPLYYTKVCPVGKTEEKDVAVASLDQVCCTYPDLSAMSGISWDNLR